jgi:hypothetical protein
MALVFMEASLTCVLTGMLLPVTVAAPAPAAPAITKGAKQPVKDNMLSAVKQLI